AFCCFDVVFIVPFLHVAVSSLSSSFFVESKKQKERKGERGKEKKGRR
ncbi:hypothetical protein Y032_0706g1697, partial [Ancylostoma ceylanicum]